MRRPGYPNPNPNPHPHPHPLPNSNPNPNQAREEAAGTLETLRAKHKSLEEKFTQREDIIVELQP